MKATFKLTYEAEAGIPMCHVKATANTIHLAEELCEKANNFFKKCPLTWDMLHCTDCYNLEKLGKGYSCELSFSIDKHYVKLGTLSKEYKDLVKEAWNRFKKEIYKNG